MPGGYEPFLPPADKPEPVTSDPAVLLLEAATMLVDIGTALTVIAKELHKQSEERK